MSSIYEKHLEEMEDQEQREVVAHILMVNSLDGAALGVARLYVDKGVNALSGPQKDVLERFVLKPYLLEHCSFCSNSIPMSEQIEAMDNGGYCSHCVNLLHKED
jgi:hypothetical protein